MTPESPPAPDGPGLALARLLAAEDEAFVLEAYRALLGREPDPKGFWDYLEQRRRGVPKIQLVASLARSVEARKRGGALRMLGDLAIRHAERDPGAQRPASLAALMALADEAFVKAAYRVALGREGDTEGVAVYTARVRAGDPRIDILRALRRSPEGGEREAVWRKSGGTADLAMLQAVDRAIQRQRWARLPLLGGLVAAWLDLDGYGGSARRMRRLENLAACAGAALGVAPVVDEPMAPAVAAEAAQRDGGDGAEPAVRVSTGSGVAARLLTLPPAFGAAERSSRA